jgi:CRISPR-associated protein Cmr1
MQHANSWIEVQRELINKDIILDAECFTISYARIGGYSGRPCSPILNMWEKIRASEIKGVWRWWARVLLATALYNRGYIVDNLMDLDKLISFILGGETSSMFEIRLTPLNIKYKDNIIEISNIPRLRLLSQLKDIEKRKYRRGAKELEVVVEPRSIIRIVITRKPDISNNGGDSRFIKLLLNDDVISYALYSLILSLLFSGIGSILTRGFGKVKINITKCYDKNLKGDLEIIYSSKNERELESNISNFIIKAINSAEKYLSYLEKNKEAKEVLNEIITKSQQSIKTKTVKIPILSLNNYFKLKVIKVPGNKPIIDILKCIGMSTLKIEWKWYNFYKVIIKKKHREDYTKLFKKEKEESRIHGLSYHSGLYHTWILGMPRKGQDGYNETGYLGIERRISNIAYSMIKTTNNENYVLIYGFLTYDWHDYIKDLIYSYNRGSSKKSVYDILNDDGILDPTAENEKMRIKKSVDIKDVFNIAFNTCSKVLEKCLEGESKT